MDHMPSMEIRSLKKKLEMVKTIKNPWATQGYYYLEITYIDREQFIPILKKEISFDSDYYDE